MRPILAIIPAFPSALIVPAFAFVALCALVFAVRALRAKDSAALSTSLFAVTGIALALWAWTRQPITLHSYGLFLIFGFAAATWGACREAQRKKINPNLILDLALPLLGFSILACRLLYVFLNREQFDSLDKVVRVWDGGLSFHGSLVAAPLVIWFYAHRNGLRFGQVSDLIAPSVLLGYAIGRLGCLLNGCCYGRACALPWAMQFPDEFQRGLTTPPSHPTQIYSFVLALILFGVMQHLKKQPRWTRFPGQLTLIFFALYALERAFIEYFRNGATARPVFGIPWLTQAQFVSLVALVVIAALWKMLDAREHGNPKPEIQNPNPDVVSSG